MDERPYAIGIDVGGVIIDRSNDNSDTSFFSDNYLNTTAVPGAIEAIGKIVQARFKDRAYIVSKCGRKTEAKTKEWLKHHKVYEITGIKPENTFFCRKREEKAPFCKTVGITHFVDDRMSVLRHMDTVPYKYLFSPTPEELAECPDLLKDVVIVQT